MDRWNMGCGHFDAIGDPRHDCRNWGKDAHPEGMGEVTFVRLDGRKVVVDDVHIDSINQLGRADESVGIIAFDHGAAGDTMFLPCIESWSIDYRI